VAPPALSGTRNYFSRPDFAIGCKLRNMSRTPDSWKKKVHPAFCEIAAMCRALAVAQKQPQRGKRAGEVRRVLNLSSQKRQEFLANRPGNSPGTPWQQVTATGYKPASPQEKLEQVLDWFFFKRNRTPRWLALEKEKEGDLPAHKQLVRAEDECWRLLNGHGPVPPFKADQPHTDLLELGLHLGLKVLSAEELADCFEEVCGCGRFHDADALKKQRGRVLNDLEASFSQSLRNVLRRPPWERFAVYGADGLIAKGYSPRDRSKYVEISRMGKGLEYVVEADAVEGYSQEAVGFPDVLRQLPAAFFVPSIGELFHMFFPRV
jgi:hypothetical protein